MKTRNPSILLVALVAGFRAMSATCAEAIIINDRPVGLALGQTLRLNFANIGDPNQIIINYRIVDADGVVLAESGRGGLAVPFGRIVSVDLNRDSIPNRDPRIQLRAEFEVRTLGNLTNLRTSVEVFDNTTGRTTIFFPPDPCAI